jgi:hypothetical protein
LAVTVAVLVALSPVEGAHEKLVYEASLAIAPFNVTLPPAQYVVLPTGVITNTGGVEAVTFTAALGPVHPAADVSSTKYVAVPKGTDTV